MQGLSCEQSQPIHAADRPRCPPCHWLSVNDPRTARRTSEGFTFPAAIGVVRFRLLAWSVFVGDVGYFCSLVAARGTAFKMDLLHRCSLPLSNRKILYHYDVD
jgi:hypothetical protein